jgi:iron(III) transport system ATP-binding protein
LLLLDEPLSALDAKVRVYLRHEVKQLQHRLGVTTVMVTHDQEEALTMADRIVVMNHGVIEQIGTPLEIYRGPASAFVADFIGTTNFLEGRLIGPERVRIGQLELCCAAGDALAPGADVIVAIRPEDVAVQDIEHGAENALEVEITEIDFLGSFVRARLDASALGAQELRADLSINLVRRMDLREGCCLPIALPQSCLRLYARAGGDAARDG